MNSKFTVGVLLSAAVLSWPSSGLDLLKFEEWKGGAPMAELSRGSQGEIKLHVPVQQKTGSFSVSLLLPKKERNLSECTEIEYTATADQDVGVSLQLSQGKNSLSWKGGKKRLSQTATTYSIPISTMKKNGSPNVKAIGRVHLNFGLWTKEVLKKPANITITNLELLKPSDRFLIPKPTAGVNIDAQYRKDWGFEDALYFWTPPKYVSIRGKKGFAKYSFMYDAEKIYFLIHVADATPFEGESDKPWENDSVELFLISKVRPKDLKSKQNLAGNGIQVDFDLSKNGRPVVCSPGGKKLSAKVRCAVRKEDVEVDGAMRPGYVLEAAIPWEILPRFNHQRGALLGYSIKVNDRSGEKIAIGNKFNPAAVINDYCSAYLEVKGAESVAEFKFTKPAKDVRWPQKISQDTIWHDTGLFHRNVDQRDRYYLNGVWAIQGAEENESPVKEWYYMPVPGVPTWSFPVWGVNREGQLEDIYFRLVTNRGPKNNPLAGKENPFFWYERQFFADPAWAGKNVGLHFDFINREADVFLNGKIVGSVSNLSPRVDLSKSLQYGKWNRLDVRVRCELVHGLGDAPRFGIAGDLWLDVAPCGPVISDLWVRKMQADGTFRTEVKLSSSAQAKQVSLQLFSPEKKLLFQTERPAAGKVVFETRIKNPPLWSWEHPNLCVVTVKVQDKDGKLIEQKSRRIGFRTFESRNGKFMLNGKIIRLRTNNFTAGNAGYTPDRIGRLKKLGFNAIYRHAHNFGWNDPNFDLMDEYGFLTFAPTDRSTSDAETGEYVRRYRNHPSVIGYVSDEYGMSGFNGTKQNPFVNDDRYLPDGEGARALYAFLTKRYELFKKFDPERFYFPLATGNWKDHFCSNFWYPTNGYTLLDRMMFHQPWSRRKNPLIPRYVMEHGMYNLYSMDVANPQEKMPARSVPSAYGQKKRILVDRWVQREAASAFIGSAAFDDWLPWSKILYGAAMRAVRLNQLDGYNLWHDDLPIYDRLYEKIDGDKPDLRKIEKRYFTEPWRGNTDNWTMRIGSRTFRNAANIVCYWGDRYGYPKTEPKKTIFHEFYTNLSMPFCIVLAGEKENLFTLDHNYYGGETLTKLVTAVNDTDGDTVAEGKVELRIAGKKAAEHPFSFPVKQGMLENHEFSFHLPAVKTRTPAKLVMTCRDRKESFRLTIFPRPEKPSQVANLGVIPGKFSVVKKAGLKAQIIDPAKPVPAAIRAIIAEAESLKKGINCAHLEKFVNEGGKLLILEQGADSVYGFRAKERRTEFGFIADPASPVVAGLSDEDLSMWRGRAESVANECIPSKYYRNGQGKGIPMPHLTNRNTVAGNVLDNPSFGSIKPIVTGGFDRESALVLSARFGKGEVLFCEADVSPRYGVEPAATLLVNNLVKELGKPLKAQYPGVRYTGGEKGKKLLDELGIAVVKDSPVCVVGEGVSTLPDGSELYIALPGAKLPFPVKKDYVESVTRPFFSKGGSTHRVAHVPGGILPTADDPAKAGPLFAGLSRNDAFIFTGPKLGQAQFKPQPGEFRSPWGTMGEVKRNGKRIVFCTLDPAEAPMQLLTGAAAKKKNDHLKGDFDLEKYQKGLLNGEIRRKLYRIWSVLFANANVANALSFSLQEPPFDFSRAAWTFLTDPDGKGEKTGFAVGNYNGRTPRPILPGIIWEEQGVTEPNPTIVSPPDSAYDGYAWYFLDVNLKNVPSEDLWFHVHGIRDLPTYKVDDQKSDLFLNGGKMPLAGCWNAFYGGRGGRLWKIPAGTLKPGRNRIAIRIYNSLGPGGIHKLPVRIERTGKNPDMLFPYEFRFSKYTNYFHWSW